MLNGIVINNQYVTNATTYSVEMLILSFIYGLLLTLLFFRKKKVKTSEIRLFGILIIICMMATFTELMLFVSAACVRPESFLENLVYKFYIIIADTFSLFFLLYNICICLGEEIYSKNKKYIRLFTIGTFLFYSILVIILPHEAIAGPTGIYADDAPARFSIALSSVFILSLFVFAYIGVKKNHVPLVKLLPCFLIVFGLLVCNTIQSFDHRYTLNSVLEMFAMFAVYLTIENPDIKIIAELSVLKDEAEKANKIKSEFLSSMSHELRTPLNAIVGLSQDIKDNNDVSDDIRSNNLEIFNASNRLLEMVDNIINMNKLSSSDIVLSEEEYDIGLEIEKIVRFNSDRIGNKPVEVKYTISNDVPDRVIGDREHVIEIVNNLFTNAIKYTNEGTITLNVNSINKDDKCTLIITVSDTGIGISSDNIKNLFKEFQRVDEVKNSSTPGAGLGLAITKNLVTLMNGTIDCESVVGEGSIFTVTIPHKISSFGEKTKIFHRIDDIENL